MRIGASGISPQDSGAPPAEGARDRNEAPGASFSTVLAQRLREPRDHIELTREAVRATIDEARSGSALIATPQMAPGLQPAAYSRTPTPSGAFGQLGADPFGWRALTRKLGDQVVAPGFGEVFEAQIQQESGFDPEVAFGYRRSSAGAEGIAQLMPQYYQGVNRRDPEASLQAAADSMRHYLAANNGDVRKALASYNAGLGTVQSLVAAHGANWERGLPSETKQYLAAIVGGAAPAVDAREGARAFGGRGPHGVLTAPVSGSRARDAGGALEWRGAPTGDVLSPADGVVASLGSGASAGRLTLDHGNGWTTLLEGLGSLNVRAGDLVRRGQPLGSLPETQADAALRLSVLLRGQPMPARPYVIDAG